MPTLWRAKPMIPYGRHVKTPGELALRSALLDAGIAAAALTASVVIGRHATAAQPGTRWASFALPILLLAQLPVLIRRSAR